MSAAQGDMDVQPVDIHNKICRFSLLPYPYKATILCFSNFVLFQQLLHVSVLYEPRHLFWALACWLAQYGYLIGVFTDHAQFTSSWCTSLAFIKQTVLYASLRAFNSSSIAGTSSISLVVWCWWLQIKYTLKLCVDDLSLCFNPANGKEGWLKITQQSMQEQDLEQGP